MKALSQPIGMSADLWQSDSRHGDHDIVELGRRHTQHLRYKFAVDGIVVAQRILRRENGKADHVARQHHFHEPLFEAPRTCGDDDGTHFDRGCLRGLLLLGELCPCLGNCACSQIFDSRAAEMPSTRATASMTILLGRMAPSRSKRS